MGRYPILQGELPVKVLNRNDDILSYIDENIVDKAKCPHGLHELSHLHIGRDKIWLFIDDGEYIGHARKLYNHDRSYIMYYHDDAEPVVNALLEETGHNSLFISTSRTIESQSIYESLDRFEPAEDVEDYENPRGGDYDYVAKYFAVVDEGEQHLSKSEIESRSCKTVVQDVKER